MFAVGGWVPTGDAPGVELVVTLPGPPQATTANAKAKSPAILLTWCSFPAHAALYRADPHGVRTAPGTHGLRVLLRPVMSDWNKGIIDEFHAKGGKGVTGFGDRLLLLTVRGAKSGQPRTVPLAYHRDGDRYVVAGSKGGAPTHPAWYHNLVKHREATIEVGTERIEVRATPIAKGPERDRLYEAHATVMPGFRGYVKKTSRVIPVVVLEWV